MFIDIIKKKNKKTMDVYLKDLRVESLIFYEERWELRMHTFANHIYVFNNLAYTTKTTPLEFKKNKMKKDVYRHYIEKNNNNNNGCLPKRFESWEFNFWWREVEVRYTLLQTIYMFSTILHIQQKQPH